MATPLSRKSCAIHALTQIGAETDRLESQFVDLLILGRVWPGQGDDEEEGSERFC